MPLIGTCPACGEKLQVPDSLAGRPVRCRGCQAVVRLGTAAPPPAAAPQLDELEVVADEADELPEVVPADGPAAPRRQPTSPGRSRLLQARRFLIVYGQREYVLLDAETDKEVGVATEQQTSGGAVHQAFGGSGSARPCTVSVYDARTEEEVFAVHREAFQRFLGQNPALVEFTTPDDRVFGSFETKIFPSDGTFWMRDAGGRKFAEVDGQWHPRPDYVFRGRDGGKLGRVRTEGERRRLLTSPFGWCRWGGELLLSTSDSLADHPEGKMLLLGTALILEITIAGMRMNAGPMR